LDTHTIFSAGTVQQTPVWLTEMPLSDPGHVLAKMSRWHSAWARAGYTGICASVWRDYAMIRRLSRWCRFR